MNRIRVLVVDDSALTRQFLREMLGSDPSIEVIATAHDPNVAREMIKRLEPDVVTLDVQMPGMNGIEFLVRLMRYRPLPVVMFSRPTTETATAPAQAKALGAFDFVSKPDGVTEDCWREAVALLIDRIKAAAQSQGIQELPKRSLEWEKPRDPSPEEQPRWPAGRLVTIGSSTGGVRALRDILVELPADSPPILIAQHMPAKFTTTFAARLDSICQVRVREVREPCEVKPGHVYLAKGDGHMLLERTGIGLVCRPWNGRFVNGCTPSVDVLFNSIAETVGTSAVGIILTGMGRDGAQGLLAIRNAGGYTAVQDEATSLIYGMPKAAVEVGAAHVQLPLSQVARFILAPRPPRAMAQPRRDRDAQTHQAGMN